jgi:hypothetical protein
VTDGSWPARQPSEHAPTSSRSLHGIDESNIVAVEVRSRAAPERFSESAHAKWSAYHSSRIGVRHEAVAARVQEATAAEPELFSHLDALYSRLRATALSATGADRTSELVSDMERAAATALHAALIECLASAGLDEESLHIWAGQDAPAAVFNVPACMPEHGGAQQWGQLVISPPYLQWQPSPIQEKPVSIEVCDCAAPEDSTPLQWFLASFAGANEDAEEHERNQLRLLQGEDDGLLFQFKHEMDVVRFERMLRVTSSTARAASTTASAVTATAPVAAAAPAAAATPPVDAKRQKRTEEPRVRAGRELREAIRNVAKLYGQKQATAAKAAMAAIAPGKSAADRTVRLRSEEMRDLLFTFGGLNTTKDILNAFLNHGEVKRLMSDELLKSREEMSDAKTATALLEAAKRFLTEMHQRVAGGRRSDAERNAFWASVVSLMPADLLENRKGRAMMRILGISYRTMKEACRMRNELEDSGKAWVLLTTNRHFDNIEKHWEIFDDWMHSEEASTPDNSRKEQIRVYRGFGTDVTTGRRGYALHWRRAQVGNIKELLATWRTSASAAKFRQATATPKRPNGVLLGRKQLVKWRCLCVRVRAASFADCKICSFVEEGIKLWHKKRFGWRREFHRKHPEHASSCHICSNPELAKQYQEMSRSPEDLKRVLLRCGKTAYPSYSIEGSRPFEIHNPLCCKNRCPKKTLTSTAEACGWSNIFGADCKAEATDVQMTWNKWVQRTRSTAENKEVDGEASKAKPFITEEWAPYTGTQAEFIGELRAAIETAPNPYFYHKDFRHKFIRHSIKLHDSRRDDKTATELADYVATLETPRGKTGTCEVPERHNVLVLALGYKSFIQTVQIPKRGKRPASSKEVRKQHVDVLFALHPSGYKPDARSYNTAAEDFDCFLKYGRVRHGEFFLDCQRLPGGDHSRPLPEGFSERPVQPPDFPEYERKLSVKDGCAMQFDGKDNYHQVLHAPLPPPCASQLHRYLHVIGSSLPHLPVSQVSEWYGKTAPRQEDLPPPPTPPTRPPPLVGTMGIRRVDWKLETMHGKNVCDPLGNMLPRTLNEAVARGDMINVGTREVLLYLARHRATPALAKLVKDGWWTVGRIFYAYYDHRQFTALNVPKAVGFKDSHECHLFAGLGQDVEAARLHGPLTVRGNVCACNPCTAGIFDDCEMKALIGPVRRVKAPREQNATSSLRQVDSLQQWAASLKKGQLVATRVMRDEACIEGLYWLIVLLGVPYTLEQDTVFNTDHFEKGDLVVKASYYKLERANLEGGFRAYVLVEGKQHERLLHVSSLIRLKGLVFDKGPGGPADRALRSGVTKLYYVGSLLHNSILSCCYE